MNMKQYEPLDENHHVYGSHNNYKVIPSDDGVDQELESLNQNHNNFGNDINQQFNNFDSNKGQEIYNGGNNEIYNSHNHHQNHGYGNKETFHLNDINESYDNQHNWNKDNQQNHNYDNQHNQNYYNDHNQSHNNQNYDNLLDNTISSNEPSHNLDMNSLGSKGKIPIMDLVDNPISSKENSNNHFDHTADKPNNNHLIEGKDEYDEELEESANVENNNPMPEKSNNKESGPHWNTMPEKSNDKESGPRWNAMHLLDDNEDDEGIDEHNNESDVLHSGELDPYFYDIVDYEVPSNHVSSKNNDLEDYDSNSINQNLNNGQLPTNEGKDSTNETGNSFLILMPVQTLCIGFLSEIDVSH